MCAVQLDGCLPGLARGGTLPRAVRKEGQNLDPGQRLAGRPHGDDGPRRRGLQLRGGNGELQVRFVDQRVDRWSSRRLSRPSDDDHDAVAPSLHQELPILRSGDVADRQAPEDRGDHLVPGRLAGFHVGDGHAVRERAGRIDLQSVVEHRQSDTPARYRVVPVRHGIDQRLEQRLGAVLRHVDAAGRPCGRRRACCARRTARHRLSGAGAARQSPARRADRKPGRHRGSGSP